MIGQSKRPGALRGEQRSAGAKGITGTVYNTNEYNHDKRNIGSTYIYI